jgi:hypothetical protein
LAIPKVIADFQASLPDAIIYVYINNSTTAQSRRPGKRVVRTETLQGKGNVVRGMFADLKRTFMFWSTGTIRMTHPPRPSLCAGSSNSKSTRRPGFGAPKFRPGIAGPTASATPPSRA